jgi:hypothetical protein
MALATVSNDDNSTPLGCSGRCLRPSVAEIKSNWSYTSIPQMPKRRSSKARSIVNVLCFVKTPFFKFFLPVALRPNAGHGLLILVVS